MMQGKALVLGMAKAKVVMVVALAFATVSYTHLTLPTNSLV